MDLQTCGPYGFCFDPSSGLMARACGQNSKFASKWPRSEWGFAGLVPREKGGFAWVPGKELGVSKCSEKWRSSLWLQIKTRAPPEKKNSAGGMLEPGDMGKLGRGGKTGKLELLGCLGWSSWLKSWMEILGSGNFRHGLLERRLHTTTDTWDGLRN